MAAIQADADAGRAVLLIAVQQIGLAEFVANLFGDMFGLIRGFCGTRTQRFERHDEFVPPQPCHGVAFAYTAGEPPGDFAQQLIADIMPCVSLIVLKLSRSRNISAPYFRCAH